jgi:hypothetical protein
VNCPRYIHRHQKLGASEHVPRAEGATALPSPDAARTGYNRLSPTRIR